MISIRRIVNDSLSSRAVQRRIACDERMERIYAANPELSDIDDGLVEVHKSRILTVFEKNDQAEAALVRRENDLSAARVKYMKDHGIDPKFDQEKPFCEHCGDTGWISVKDTKSICRFCMKSELNECFDKSGMKDYSSYKIKAFDLGFTGQKQERANIFKAGKEMIEHPDAAKSLAVYSGAHRSGKTFLSVILVKYAIIEGKSAYYSKAEQYGSFEEDELDYLKDCEFLVIDDYESEVTLNWRTAVNLNSVLEARIASGLPTMLVSASPKADLVSGSDARIAGKLTGATSL